MIRILPQNVINKIAAGEVVERPASVVKELVENALDAGASSIKVAIRGNALGGIEVVDDGCGMSGQDASICLEHHATSKITAVADLNAIGSFGFRGEALSSIAAVSKITLITRSRESETGLKLEAVAGEIRSKEPAAAVVGTRVRIEDLFFNVPARRKFLKSVRTEEALVAETIRNMALTAPAAAFHFRKEGRDMLSLPAAEEKQRVEDVFKGKSLFFAEGKESGFSLRAYLTLPEHARRGTGGLVLIVNRRVVADRAIAGAIAAGHEGLLDKGRYPEGALFLEVPPELVDVNVHPQKREIRFTNASAVFTFTRRSIRSALKLSPRPEQRTASAAHEDAPSWMAVPDDQTAASPGPFGSGAPAAAAAPASAPLPDESSSAPAAIDFFKGSGFFTGLNVIGRLFSTYILCESDEGLVIIDQHAAAERVTYEDMRRQYRGGGVQTQILLMPATVMLDEKSAAAVEENEGFLKALGIDASASGRDCALVRALPSILGNVNPETLLVEVMDQVQSGCGRTGEAVEAILQRMACHGSVRAGRRLEKEEIEALLRRLDTVDFGAHCPHGRPVTMSISRKEIESKMGRR